MQRDRFVALDGLRGVAAIAVVLCHARLPGARFAYGYLAVDLFFLLSGFVIAKSYEPRLLDGRLTVARYALVRLRRLYPLLFLGTLLGIALWGANLSDIDSATPQALPLAMVSQLLLLPCFACAILFPFNGAHWSIFFELAANLGYGLMVRHLSVRALSWIVAVSAAGLVVAVRRFGSLNIGWGYDNFAGGIPRVGFGFFGGILLWRTRGHWQERIPRLSSALLGVILLLLLNLPPQAPAGEGGNAWLEPTIVVLGFPALVMAASRAEAGRVAAALGTLSFPLYAVHLPLIEAARAAPLSEIAQVAVLVLVVVGAWALGWWVDEPLGEWWRARREMRTAARPDYA